MLLIELNQDGTFGSYEVTNLIEGEHAKPGEAVRAKLLRCRFPIGSVSPYFSPKAWIGMSETSFLKNDRLRKIKCKWLVLLTVNPYRIFTAIFGLIHC
jgi:hypothetical protein